MTTETLPQKSAAPALAVADSNETAYRIAQSAPDRNFAAIWKNIEQEMVFAPEYAEDAWYSIPYKGGAGPVEGIGIRGFECLARAWGHCASGGGIREDQGDKVICRGIFYDHKTNQQFYKEVMVNRYQVDKDGKTYRLVGKHWDNAIQSAVSKAQRNAGLEGLPQAIKEKFFTLAKKLTLAPKAVKAGEKVKTVKEKIEDAKNEFIKKFGITAENFSDYVNGTNYDNDDDLFAHLKGLYTGLKSGEYNTQEVFGVAPPVTGKPVMTKPVEVNPDELPGV